MKKPIELFSHQASGWLKQRSRLMNQFLLLLICLLPLLSYSTGCSQRSTPPNEPELLVGLSFGPRHIIIDNQNDFVWKKVAIKLNGQYSYITDILPRGPSSIPFSSFLEPQGKPFNPEEVQPHQLIINVQEGFNGHPGQFIW